MLSPHVASSPQHAERESVRAISEIAEMSAIFDAAVNVVILRRSLPGPLEEEARRAVGEPPARVLASISPTSRGRADVDALLPTFPFLAADVHFWAEVLAELTDCELVGVRLARVVSAMCPRLHVDKVALRMVCTFFGAGTEYAGHAEVDRRRLGHASGGLSDEDSGLLSRGARVRRASVGDVLLLKGEAWPDNEGRGAVHRSPAASPDAPRLVMTLDPL